MKTRVILENSVEDHALELFQGSGRAAATQGFGGLDVQAVERYHHEGFLLVRDAIPNAMVCDALSELQAMTQADDPACESIYYEASLREHLREDCPNPNSVVELPLNHRRSKVRKLMGFLDHHPPLAAIAAYPALIEAIATLAGEPVRIFQDMAMLKPPGGREKPWHQDHAYFNLPLDTRIVAVWLALGEVTPENGCMFVIPGGHRDGPRIHFARRDWQLCDDEMLAARPLAVPMSPGDVLLFDGKLPHGTPTNRTPDWRWALQFHYIPTSAQEVDESVRLHAFGSEGKDVTC